MKLFWWPQMAFFEVSFKLIIIASNLIQHNSKTNKYFETADGFF